MPHLIHDPVLEPHIPEARLAPRLGTLAGARVGLYSNQKTNAAELLADIGAILQQRYGVTATANGTYVGYRLMQPEEWGDVDGFDAVILTHGD